MKDSFDFTVALRGVEILVDKRHDRHLEIVYRLTRQSFKVCARVVTELDSEFEPLVAERHETRFDRIADVFKVVRNPDILLYPRG